MPTSTWGAYNFYDQDGDGWGDTWYARWKTNQADLTRPQPSRGVPYRYRSYDLAFQRWLAQTNKQIQSTNFPGGVPLPGANMLPLPIAAR